jgi:acyl-CoA thioesterase-1
MTAFLEKTRSICLGTWDCNKQRPGCWLAVEKPQAGAGSLTGRILQALRTVALLFLLSAVPWAEQAQSSAATAPAATAPLRLLVVGDSLSAEYGLARGTGWVALLQKRLLSEKSAVTVINASISGDTTSGGRSRLPGLLKQHQPQIVIIELGGNDALRGLPLDMTEQNLLAMTQAAQKVGARVLLLGMQVPPNYGSAYTAAFEAMYVKVAKATQSPLVPFFLKGVADIDKPLQFFQSDRIHPNESAHPIMLATVWQELRKLLK